MYRNNRFSELLKGFPRKLFEQAVKTHQFDKYSKRFSAWNHAVAMIYGQVSGAASLRELEEGFNSQHQHHYHLGCQVIRHSTLSDANAKRDCRVFKQVCDYLVSQVHRKLKQETKALLYLLDSTPIVLKGLGYDAWTLPGATHRTQGLKAHIMIESESDSPVFLSLTEPRVNDIEVGRGIELVEGATYVFDKGYCDYNWWFSIHEHNAKFVTRFKYNASLVVDAYRSIPAASDSMILEDAIVSFKHRCPGGGRVNHYQGTSLRRIKVYREGDKQPLVIATNDLESSAEHVAGLYKQRWQIELLFKWLKQNLKIKRYFGRSENAVKIQLYTALITYLLGQQYCQQAGYAGSLKLFFVVLRECLFQRPAIEVALARKRRRLRSDFLSKQQCLVLR